MVLKLVQYKNISECKNGFVLVAADGSNILLGDMPQMEKTTTRIPILPGNYLLKDQVMLLAFYYNPENRRLQAQPLSIITDSQVVRLLY